MAEENNPIKLNDLLHLPEELKHWWLTLNVNNEVPPIKQWLDRSDDDSDDGLNFSFYPYKAKMSKWLSPGDCVVVAVKMPKDNVWLLVSVNQVTKIHYDTETPYAERVAVEEYKKWFGRVIFSVTDKKAQGYAFHLNTFLDRCVVQQVLAKPYDGEDFPGYDGIVNVKFRDLQNYLYGKNYGSSWYHGLSKYTGIYCLRDKAENRIYVGSAYGDDGLAQRLNCYMETLHGGNEELVKLYNEKAEKEGEQAAEHYFLDNFYYSIVELMPKNSTQNDVVTRETHWKAIFDSKNLEIGMNKN